MKGEKKTATKPTATIAGLNIVEVAPQDLQPNPFNPNRQASEVFVREKRSIERHGFIAPIIAREVEGRLQIVDGEHRWRAAQELGLTRLPVVNLGAVSESDARRLVVLLNELKGEPEPALLADLLKTLIKDGSTSAELAEAFPMEAAEIDSLVRATDFSWDELGNTTKRAPGEPEYDGDSKRNPHTGAEDRRFVIGGVQGFVPRAIADRFTEQYKASAAALGSKNVELVVRDLVARLERAPSTAVPLDTAKPKEGVA